jgi:hypothetical protein
VYLHVLWGKGAAEAYPNRLHTGMVEKLQSAAIEAEYLG